MKHKRENSTLIRKMGIYLSSTSVIEKTEALCTTIKLEDFIDKYEKDHLNLVVQSQTIS